MKRRYPGPLPFSYDDRSLSFGRDADIDYLTTLIINNQITILHGKSGYEVLKKFIGYQSLFTINFFET
jgi:hypothetical protein